jgi:hypothetical protein
MSDCGTYNKHKQFAGRHGTLIGNWYEEQALKTPGDVTRPRYLNTFERTLAHYDNHDSEPKETINMSTYKPLFSSAAELGLTQSFPNQRKAMLDSIDAQSDRRKFQTTYQSSICLPKTTRPGAAYVADTMTGTFKLQMGTDAKAGAATASADVPAAQISASRPATRSGKGIAF